MIQFEDDLNNIDSVLADHAAYRQGYLDGLRRAEQLYLEIKLQIGQARTDTIASWGQRDVAAGKIFLIEEFGLTARATNILKDRNILTIQALCQCTKRELESLKGFGSKTVKDVVAKLAIQGLSLRSAI